VPEQTDLLRDTHDLVVAIKTILEERCERPQKTLDYHTRVLNGKDGEAGLKGRVDVVEARVEDVQEEAETARAWSRRTIGTVVAAFLAMVGKWILWK